MKIHVCVCVCVCERVYLNIYATFGNALIILNCSSVTNFNIVKTSRTPSHTKDMFVCLYAHVFSLNDS